MDTTNASAAEFAAATEATGPENVSLWRLLRGLKVDPLERWTKFRVEHGDVARYRYGLSDTFFVSSAEGAKRVLQDNIANYTKDHPVYGMIRRVFGNGLLTSQGSFWLRQRRLAQPAFHRQRIGAMATQMIAAAAQTVEQWESKAKSDEPVSMLHEMSGLTLRVVGDALFGTALAPRAARVTRSWDTLNQQMVERFSRKRLLPPILPTRYDREFRTARKMLFEVVDQIIADKRAQASSPTDDLLSMFMHARDEDTGEQMSDAQLRDEVITMLLAGHETTAVALSWAWAMLDRHPAVARRLHEELDCALGDRAPTAADIPNLPYTRAIVDETLRLHPPAFISHRHVKNNDVICGRRIHAGGAIVMSPLIFHRHPDYWEKPDEFLPERWADQAAEKGRPRFAYIPFSAGPRQCIGNTFSLMESVLVLATLAQRFAPKMVEGYELAPEYLVLARPRGGLPMQLNRRA